MSVKTKKYRFRVAQSSGAESICVVECTPEQLAKLEEHGAVLTEDMQQDVAKGKPS